MKRREKTVSYKKHQERKRSIVGLKVIGIDPAKEKHHVTVIDEQGIQMGHRPEGCILDSREYPGRQIQ